MAMTSPTTRTVNPVLGGLEGWQRFRDAVAGAGMGVVLDVVANHMGADEQANPWWRDVLEHGQASRYADFFDIEWTPPRRALAGRLLLPVLGEPYGAALERGALQVRLHDDWFAIAYGDRLFPVDPASCAALVRADVSFEEWTAAGREAEAIELLSIATSLDHLPPRVASDQAVMAERVRESRVASTRLSSLMQASPAVRDHLERVLSRVNGDDAEPAARLGELHALLEQQAYRLAFWRTAGHDINYRRFFDINELVSMRMERPEVFDAAHAAIAELLDDPVVHGLRIDHPDGLRDPGEYFARVQALARSRGACCDRDPEGTYLLVEKILSGDERLHDDWPVHGTTGYNVIDVLGGAFVATANEQAVRKIYRRFTGRRTEFVDEVYEAKRLVMHSLFGGELHRLSKTLAEIAEMNPRSRDFTEPSLRDLLEEYVAALPVYRTYLTDDACRPADLRYVRSAIDDAARRQRVEDPSVSAFLSEVLLHRAGGDPAQFAAMSDDEQQRRRDFSTTLQQYSGPVHAKAVEDTAFYRCNALVSLNEVGGDPGVFGRSTRAFHEAMGARRERWPFEMSASSTHDTKLGEDVRARIAALSELPREWSAALSRWARINARYRTRIGSTWAPSRNDEYRFYQVLLGVWPAAGTDPAPATAAIVERLTVYMLKAVKEAKLHTSWIDPEPAYDEAVTRFVAGVLTGPASAAFFAAFAPLWRRTARAGVVNSLGQLVARVAAPGVPDIYQGTEGWGLALVDPDNRRGVDFTARTQWRDELDDLAWRPGDVGAVAPDRLERVAALAATWWDPRLKMLVMTSVLRARKAWRDVFLDGEYIPHAARGSRADHVLAFERRLPGTRVLAVVTRLSCALETPGDVLPLGAAWADTVMTPGGPPGTSWMDILTGQRLEGESLPLHRVFSALPVSLLVSSS